MRTKVVAVIAALLLSVGLGGCKPGSDTDLVRLAYPETFDRMVNNFRGRVIYVDIFASWCKPCIEQFGYAAQTDDFFVGNNIAKLYISADLDATGIQEAFRLLRRHNMKGYFLSVRNPADIDDKSSGFYGQMQRFCDIGGRVVPQYMIIDKTGNVVEYMAEKPGSPEALKEQLSKYL